MTGWGDSPLGPCHKRYGTDESNDVDCSGQWIGTLRRAEGSRPVPRLNLFICDRTDRHGCWRRGVASRRRGVVGVVLVGGPEVPLSPGWTRFKETGSSLSHPRREWKAIHVVFASFRPLARRAETKETTRTRLHEDHSLVVGRRCFLLRILCRPPASAESHCLQSVLPITSISSEPCLSTSVSMDLAASDGE